jgi:hypothetical protein
VAVSPVGAAGAAVVVTLEQVPLADVPQAFFATM